MYLHKHTKRLLNKKNVSSLLLIEHLLSHFCLDTIMFSYHWYMFKNDLPRLNLHLAFERQTHQVNCIIIESTSYSCSWVFVIACMYTNIHTLLIALYKWRQHSLQKLSKSNLSTLFMPRQIILPNAKSDIKGDFLKLWSQFLKI